MRRLAFVVSVLIFTFPNFAAEEKLRLEGVAYTEGSAEEVQIQVWALGEQVADHSEWQTSAVFDGSVAPGKAFAVDLGETRLPVLVEMAAENHVAVSLQVVLPEQLRMPPAWLRSGEPLNIRVTQPGRDDERLVAWGGFWVDQWGWDRRRWRVAVPHSEVPASGALTVFRPPTTEAVWLFGVGESGACGTLQRRSAGTSAVRLKIDSAPMTVRVWDGRKRPLSGVSLRVEGSPLETEVVTDDEGRATLQVPTETEWKIVAIDDDSQGVKTGRGVPGREVDIDLEPRVDIELRWPEALGTVVIGRERPWAPTVISSGRSALPKNAMGGSLEFWGPEIAPGRLRLAEAEGPVELKAQLGVRLEGLVKAPTGISVDGLPVWLRLDRSAISPTRRFMRRGRATPLDRPWLPWAVTDAAGRFSIAGLPPGGCEVEVRAPGYPAARSERLEGKAGEVLETIVRLREGVALALRVVDPDGVPLAGATIDLYRSTAKGGSSMVIDMGRRDKRGDPELTALTDEEGRAHLESVPVGSVRLRLSRPGSVARAIDPLEVPAEGIDIGDQVLEPGVTIAGTTVGPDGEPVAEAEVALDRSPQVPFLRPVTTSDEDGRFSIPDLESSGEVYLQARAEGLVPEAPLKVELPPDGEIEIAMAKERILEGLVLDGRGDSPIEGASISLHFERDTAVRGVGAYGRSRMSAGSSSTDASGRFLIDGLWAGEFQIYVSAEGMRRVQQKVLIGDGDLDPVIIRLEPGLELRGRVETADGDPATGVTVTAGPASRTLGGGSADSSGVQTGVDGRFHFDALGPGTQSISARSEDGLSARATAEAGQTAEVVLRFARCGVIRGIVYKPDGAPMAGARVTAFSRGAFQSVGDESGPHGRFELTEVGPGAWVVGASVEGFAPASEEVEVSEGDTATIDLHLERGAAVVGEVRGLSGAELETCMVRIGWVGTAKPTADGTFRIDGVAAGETQVVAIEMTTRRSRSVGVVVPEAGESAPVVIDFASGLAVYGRVFRGSTGVQGLTVSVVGVATSTSSDTVSGPDGGWRVEGLDPGEYQIAAQSRSGGVVAGDHVILETDTELDLYLSSGSIRGRVLEADNERPIEGAAVTIVGSSIPPVQRAATTGVGGEFEVSDLGDGDYTVQADVRDHLPAQETVSIRDGSAPEITLVLENDERTVFVVQGADGSPASGIWIQSLTGGVLGPFVTSTCAAGGRCEVKDIPRGRWTLLIRGEGMALLVTEIPQAEVPVQLRAAGTLEIKGAVDDTGAAWQVRLSEAGTGIVVPIYQFDNPARTEWVPVSASGLRLQLPEGAWRIDTFAPDGTQGVQQATVTPDGTTEVRLE
jgi:hypothetical protein